MTDKDNPNESAKESAVVVPLRQPPSADIAPPEAAALPGLSLELAIVFVAHLHEHGVIIPDEAVPDIANRWVRPMIQEVASKLPGNPLAKSRDEDVFRHAVGTAMSMVRMIADRGGEESTDLLERMGDVLQAALRDFAVALQAHVERADHGDEAPEDDP